MSFFELKGRSFHQSMNQSKIGERVVVVRLCLGKKEKKEKMTTGVRILVTQVVKRGAERKVLSISSQQQRQ